MEQMQYWRVFAKPDYIPVVPSPYVFAFDKHREDGGFFARAQHTKFQDVLKRVTVIGSEWPK